MTGEGAPTLAWFQTRRSIRRYRPEPVARPLIEALLTAAAWAPSAHNRQPWRFAVVDRPVTKARLAAAMGARLRADLMADGLPEPLIGKDVDRSYSRLTGAPVLIVVNLTLADMDGYPDARRQAHERTMAVQSTAMAGQNLLLAAHAEGLGACWLCAPLFCPDVVRETLRLPLAWEPQGIVALGYPAQTPQKTRAPLASRTLFIDQEPGSSF